MGGCVSTHGKSRRRRPRNAFTKVRKRSRGSANFVIPVSQSSLGVAGQKYELGDNAKKESPDGRQVSAFLIERKASSTRINGSGHSSRHLDRQDSGAAYSIGSRDETFFETDMSFNSDDEYMSVLGDFPSSNNNSLTYPSNNTAASQRPSVAELRAGILQADKLQSHSSGKSTSPEFHSQEDGVVNGLAALTGTTPDNFRSDVTTLDRSPRKSLRLPGQFKVTSIQGKRLETSASDLPGRNTSVPDTPSDLNSGSSGNAGDNIKSSDNKRVFDSLCMPRFRPSIPSSRSRPTSPRYTKKKSSILRFSFKRHTSLESQEDLHERASAKYFIDRPMAGTQVPRCSCERPVDGCWSEVAPSVFKLRGKHYSKDKKKHPAPNYTLFLPVGVDLFMSPRKLDHIAQYVELPFQDSLPGPDSLPGVFIVNIQLPIYPPSIFLGDANGDGLSLVLYFKLSEESMQKAPPFVGDMLRKFVSDEMEKVKGFVGDTHHSFRDRLKLVARVVNPEDIHLSGAEKKLLTNYNEKPVLSRPQHCFHRGANYMEVDLDVHRFSFIARKGFDTFRERLKHCILDIGLTIQATKQEELPEQVLAAVRLHKLDFGECKIMEEGCTLAS
ncbi:hypothetical protein R1flu_006763 [Riccia fluitans]|uniref:Protein ENHANCED DISEASE RESISTANCE 2 C-terminal domain-containing protein n=1 Tax=Riccia fluitans TaxID=41844 RepID=A0ABD1YWX3_9MARC